MRFRGPLNHWSCARPTGDLQRAVSVAVVGSGPAGMYTADELLRCARPPRCVHVFEKGPLPFGLLRYGVAPDHPEVKLVTHKFHNEVLDEASVRLFGNVEVGRDVSLAQLCASYDAVFLCHGAAESRYLPLAPVDGSGDGNAVPYGERQYVSSEQFVGWYNGDLQHVGRDFELDRVKNVVVIGAGNVAMDVARMLVKSPDLLEETDITRVALAQLRRSSVSTVTIVARRGAVNAAFATKELRELTALPNLDIAVEAEQVRVADPEALDRPVRRLLKLLEDVAARPSKGPGAKRLRFAFEQTPTGLLLDEKGRVRALRTSREDLAAELVIASVGYHGHTVDPVLAPLSPSGSHLVNQAGRISRGLYVTGWAKRGASGIVATNKFCAAETVSSFLQDNLAPEKPGVPPALPERALTREQMERIENCEKARGKGKFTSVEEIMQCLRSLTEALQ